MRAALLLSVVVLAQMGCNQNSSQPGLVAVVDLDRVADELGRDNAISTAIKQREAALTKQVAGAKSSYEQQLLNTKAKLGENPTTEQTQQLAKLQQQANLQLNQVAQQAKGNLDEHRRKLVLQFRNEAKAVAREVAKEKGLSIVVTRNDSVILVHDEAADITAEVTQRMKATTLGMHSLQGPLQLAQGTPHPVDQMRQ